MNRESLVEKFFTKEVKGALAGVRTASGFSIDDVVRSGIENPDSSIGAYAGDAESYERFALFFDQVIQAYHGLPEGTRHVSDLNPSNLEKEVLDPNGSKVVSTRIRVARNLEGIPFPPAMSRQDRLEVERRAVTVLSGLKGDLRGNYFPLGEMSEAVRRQLVKDHFLFKKGDRFLESAGVNRDWPVGRGIFHSEDKRFLVWVNEEDHLRVISMQPGGDIYRVFERLARALDEIGSRLEFSYSDRLGYLTSCPTNLGTAMRASVHIDLSHLCDDPGFRERCEKLRLSVRGIHGEHSEDEGGVFDISNKERLGLSEVETIQLLQNGIRSLLTEAAS